MTTPRLRHTPHRPQLNPALRVLWRDDRSVQIGLDPTSAVLLTGVDEAAYELLLGLDGSRTHEQIVNDSTFDPLHTSQLIEALDTWGLLDDAGLDTSPLGTITAPLRDALADDLALLGLHDRTAGAAMQQLGLRRAAWIEIVGEGRVAHGIATLLAASGVGRVTCAGGARVESDQVAPLGPTPTAVGERSDRAMRVSVTQASSGSSSTAPLPQDRPLLVVLAPVCGVDDPLRRDALMRDGAVHLFASIRETTGIVGPLVVPGSTACLRCQDLHRADRDSRWPAVAVQLASESSTRTTESIALSSLVASSAAMTALSFVDTGTPGQSVASARYFQGREGWVHEQPIAVHGACGCDWAG